MRQSRLLLLEDGIQLGPAHSNHRRISTTGGGAYSHWGDTIYFSATDDSDPRTNGRSYIGLWTARTAEPRVEAAYQVLAGLEQGFPPEAAYAAVEDILSILYPAARMGEDKKLFWMDEELLRDYQRFDKMNMRSLERKAVVFNLVRALGQIEGDLAECGAYQGATAYFMAKADREAGRTRPLHLFDSFEGLSPPDEVDGTHWHEGDLAAGEATIRAHLAKFDGISFYKGWIPERFHQVDQRSFAFVHLDVDLYKPTLDSLAFFYPRVVENGIILCDDSGTATCPGATKAMMEFFADKSERIISLPTGQDFIIKHRSDGGPRPSP